MWCSPFVKKAAVIFAKWDLKHSSGIEADWQKLQRWAVVVPIANEAEIGSNPSVKNEIKSVAG
jgi:hypothetical protein